MKKRILFVINSLGQGGAEKSLVSLLNTINYDLYDIDLLMFNPSGMFIRQLPATVHILPQLKFLASNFSIKKQICHPKYLFARVGATIGLRIKKNRNLHDAQKYWKYAGWAFDKQKESYDVAIAWGQDNPTHYVIQKVNAKKKIAFVNVNYEASGHNKNFDYPYYQKYNYIVCVSEELRKLMVVVFPEFESKLVTIYDINNSELITKRANEGNPFEEEKRIVLVTTGRLTPEKNCFLLVRTAAELKNRGFSFVWYVVGEGIERKNMERWIKEYGVEEDIVLTGLKENPYPYMKNADIYVQTSKYEGYCLTLAEARILNTPIVSTNFDVVYDQISDGKNGLIAEMNPISMADAIMKLCEDSVLRNYIVENLKKEKKGNKEEIEKLYFLINND